MKKEKFECEISSGNVFADLKFDNPEEMLAKAELTRQIYELIKKKKLSKSAAAKLLNIDQQRLSALITGKLLEDLTFQDLFKFLNNLGQNIIIQVKPTISSKQKAYVRVDVPVNRKDSMIIKRYKALEELTKQAQELDMGY